MEPGRFRHRFSSPSGREAGCRIAGSQ
jgi:hypothetical protein